MSDRDRYERERETSVAELVDGAVRRLSTAIAIAGLLIALGIYARPRPPAPPTYQAFSTGSSIVRLNTKTGWILECIDGRCGTVLRPGQDFDSRPPKALPAPPATKAPAALPAPEPKAAPAPAT